MELASGSSIGTSRELYGGLTSWRSAANAPDDDQNANTIVGAFDCCNGGLASFHIEEAPEPAARLSGRRALGECVKVFVHGSEKHLAVSLEIVAETPESIKRIV
ncbi:MAG: hypothetical protein H0U66_06070 [Gemmatimonadaceae bacterium]|nr:hypothetical protein [Gemmatimonadaceae bacterium]